MWYDHYSLLSAHLALLLKNEKPASCGGTLAAMRQSMREIVYGHVVKLRRHRTTFLIGGLLTFSSLPS